MVRRDDREGRRKGKRGSLSVSLWLIDGAAVRPVKEREEKVAAAILGFGGEEELAQWFLGSAEVKREEEKEKAVRRCGLSPEVMVKGGGRGGAEVMVMEVMVAGKRQ
ncbi:hypothetical protein S245_052543 [Arachis hypogaea]